MTDSEKKNSYRIGQFAKKMGVTPDLLKYYEQQGILRSNTGENGYRYYSFEQSGRILECMRLKSYGFSLREIDELLDSGMDTIQEKTEVQIQQLEEKITFEQQIIQDFRQMSRLLERMGERSSGWRVEWGEETLFLPHSSERTFLDDPNIYELLKDWIGRMPLVKSAMEIPLSCLRPEAPPENYRWGLMVSGEHARRTGLPVNQAVKRLPERKLFQFFFRGMEMEASPRLPLKQALEQLEELGLTATGDVYGTIFLYGNMKQNPRRCGVISIPID